MKHYQRHRQLLWTQMGLHSLNKNWSVISLLYDLRQQVLDKAVVGEGEVQVLVEGDDIFQKRHKSSLHFERHPVVSDFVSITHICMYHECLMII